MLEGLNPEKRVDPGESDTAAEAPVGLVLKAWPSYYDWSIAYVSPRGPWWGRREKGVVALGRTTPGALPRGGAGRGARPRCRPLPPMLPVNPAPLDAPSAEHPRLALRQHALGPLLQLLLHARKRRVLGAGVVGRGPRHRRARLQRCAPGWGGICMGVWWTREERREGGREAHTPVARLPACLPCLPLSTCLAPPGNARAAWFFSQARLGGIQPEEVVRVSRAGLAGLALVLQLLPPCEDSKSGARG